MSSLCRNYKPPSTLEIPQQFNVHLWPTQDQVNNWKREERAAQLKASEMHASGSGTASPPPRAASRGVLSLVSSRVSVNPVRKSWLRLSPLDIVVDPYGVQSSKASGEPPTVLGNAVYFAVRNAVKAAIEDRTKAAAAVAAKTDSSAPAAPIVDIDVQLVCPATTFNIRQAIQSMGRPKERKRTTQTGTIALLGKPGTAHASPSIRGHPSCSSARVVPLPPPCDAASAATASDGAPSSPSSSSSSSVSLASAASPGRETTLKLRLQLLASAETGRGGSGPSAEPRAAL